MAHKAGFVNIIGRPNVGKSTLMNQLVGEKLSIITSKAQTTRHRILGIVNAEDYQIVFSDTPGIVLNPASKLHEAMLSFVNTSFEDADILLFITDIFERYDELADTIEKIKHLDIPKILIINKVDLGTPEKIKDLIAFWEEKKVFTRIVCISALLGTGVSEVFDRIVESLPESPPYYDKEELTDRPERFFVSEIIREKIFTNYRKEIPYSTEVVVDSFKDEEKIVRIHADIYVERKTQKSILIGKGGLALKKVGQEARKDIEAFVGKQVYLELFVKVKDKWRDNPGHLRQFGYQ